MSEERNEFTPDLFTLEDEDGNEQVFELLDVLEYEDNTYYALVPYYGDDEDALAQDDGEFVILKTEEVNGEEMLVSIEEDAEYETIGNKFLERLNEIYGDEASALPPFVQVMYTASAVVLLAADTPPQVLDNSTVLHD